MHISIEIGFVPVLDRLIAVVELTNVKAATGEVLFTPKRGKCVRVLRVVPKIEAIPGGRVTDVLFRKGAALFYIELSESCNAIKVTTRDGTRPYEVTCFARPLHPERADQFLHILGAHAFLIRDYREANRLLALAEQRTQEQADALDPAGLEQAFKQYFHGRKFIGQGLKSSGPNRCVVNALRVLIQDAQNVVYLASDAYHAEQERRPDPRVIIPPERSVRTLQVVGYRSHADRRNFSFLCRKDALVRLRSGQVRSVQIWRTYHIIRDGALCLTGVHASLSHQSFQALKDAGLIDSGRYKAGQVYWINWAGLPIVSSAWANPQVLGLVPLLKEEANLEARLTLLNMRCVATEPAHPKQPRIKSLGGRLPMYRERLGAVIASRLPEQVECCRLRLQGYKPAGGAVDHLVYEQALAEVQRVRRRLTVVRFLIRLMLAAMDKVKSTVIPWNEGKVNRHGKRVQLADFDGAKLKLTRWIEKTKV